MRNRPPTGRRRLALALSSLLGGSALIALPTTAGAADGGGVAVQYRTSASGATADQSEPWLKVRNTGSTSVQLSQVKIRYYFKADSASTSYRFACSWAVKGCANITGTFGTLVALPIAYALWHWVAPIGFIVAVVVLGLVGIVAAHITGLHLGVHDHGAIVCDEVVAYLAVLAYTGPDLRYVAAGFVLFRFFDIVKPQPIRAIDERVANGFGVMLDDVLAAAYTIALLALARTRWP